MIRRPVVLLLFISVAVSFASASGSTAPGNLSTLTKDQKVAGFRVLHLYSDAHELVIGAQFTHVQTGAPIYVLQIETAPQVFMWVDTPTYSNSGLPHALEHLLAGKGTKGRYSTLLRDMRLSVSAAATDTGFNFYEFASGTGLTGFFEQFHAWLDALYHSDFTDLEAEREFYHFGVAKYSGTNQFTLVEQGTVYSEMQPTEDFWNFSYGLNKRLFGEKNPLSYRSAGNPPEMRAVTPEQIRAFYKEHYRLGPGTGFIFVISPRENFANFLRKISHELNLFAPKPAVADIASPDVSRPKYPISPSSDTDVGIYPFPAEDNAGPGKILLGWKPVKTDTVLQLMLFQLLARALGDGEQSLLYAALIDRTKRQSDLGITTVSSEVSLRASPHFPVMEISIEGVPGTRITQNHLQALRSIILEQITEVARYPDHSAALLSFDRLVSSTANAWQRDLSIWTRNPPLFGYLGRESKWKEHFELLGIDTSFVQSVTTEKTWREITTLISSGKNIWRSLIKRFGLMDIPYVTASAPSHELLQRVALEKEQRAADKMQQLMHIYHTESPEHALAEFDAQEHLKTIQIDKIGAAVPQPHFTDHPPLSPDEGVHYTQQKIAGVNAIIVDFARPPTIDLGLSFNLKNIPENYYKYLPLLPRSVDALGLRTGKTVMSYSELSTRLRTDIYKFSVSFGSNSASSRAELNIRFSSLGASDFRSGLTWIRRIISHTDLNLSNLSRLQDVIHRIQSEDDTELRQAGTWVFDSGIAFRYRMNPLTFSLNSAFTRAHWDDRLGWMLHDPISSPQIASLDATAQQALSLIAGKTRNEILPVLDGLGSTPLEKELFAYWRKNLRAFPESDLIRGLRRLTSEVEQDLRQGPGQTIIELKELQQIVIGQSGLNLDLTADKKSFRQIKQDLASFVKSLPTAPLHSHTSDNTAQTVTIQPQRHNSKFGEEYPWFMALPWEDSTTGAVVFTAKFLGYDQLDHDSLINRLASQVFAGVGPKSFYLKTWEAGLAYSNGLGVDQASRLITYYADRSPDLGSLIELVNSLASNNPEVDQSTVDYLLSQTFSIPRSMWTFSQRGRALAEDIRDGDPPDKIRRFSEAILQVSKDRNLLTEIANVKLQSICGILLKDECQSRQKADDSIFFFVGSAKILSDLEKRLSIPDLPRIWPNDFWLQ